MTLVELGLEIMKKRYFCEPLGEVKHLSGCETNRVKKPRFCSCGLLYDLNYYFIFSDLTEVVYPNYQKDLYLQETQKEPRPNEDKKVQKAIEELLSAIDTEKESRDLIFKIFGNRFPGALTRLQGRSS